LPLEEELKANWPYDPVTAAARVANSPEETSLGPHVEPKSRLGSFAEDVIKSTSSALHKVL
jgi:hypothetical protein